MTQTPWGFKYADVGQSLFGHKDYYKAGDSGASDMEIKKWLDKNMGSLHQTNLSGGAGGLYDLISKRAGREQEQQNIYDTFQEEVANFRRERSEQKFSGSTRVGQAANSMAIGPRGVSPGMSTGSLSRDSKTKKKSSMTSGLNIGASTGLSY